MIKIILAIILISLNILYARSDDFENITNAFQIRNLQNGIALNIQRTGDMNTQNWFLREFDLPPELHSRDKLRDKWPFAYVQFVRPENPDNCLAIGNDGLLTLKSCLQDIKDAKLETVFSLIPTSIGAVQIRSLVLESNECLSAFENPNIPIEKRFGITPCSLDFFFLIETAELFFFTPALVNARALPH